MKTDDPLIDLLVKFGGSAISDKSVLETLKPDALKIACRCIKQCIDSGLTCIVVHGAGSFGHHQAKTYGVNQGLCEVKTAEEKERRMKGFCLTRQSVTKLNKLVVDSLIEQGVPAVSCSPGIGWKTKLRQPVKWPREELAELLRNGLVPVFHGDCCFDEELGCCILSGDTIIKSICSNFSVKRVVFFTDVAGIYNKPPDQPASRDKVIRLQLLFLEDDEDETNQCVVTCAELLKTIHVNQNGTTETDIASSCGLHDVTGGISLKLQTAFDIVSSTSSIVYICAVHSKEAECITLFQSEDDENLQFTRILCMP